MSKPTGEHSARRKGDNGSADPKSSSETYDTQDGKGSRGNSGAGDNTRALRVVTGK
jgi:hypothetical protein